MEIRLRPVTEPLKQVQELEVYLLFILRKYLYSPIARELQIHDIIRNSFSDLLAAIETGTIRYTVQGFTGAFTAKTSKALKDLGAKWEVGKWVIPTEQLPADLQRAIATQAKKDEELKKNFGNILDNLQKNTENTAKAVKPGKYFNRTEAKVNSDITKSFKSAVEAVTISPSLSKEAKDNLKLSYTENLKLGIKNFTDEEIIRLRKQIESHVFAGNRHKEIAKMIEASFGVGKRKAKFLARQETNLLTAKLKEQRYAEAGVDDYEWRTVVGTEAHPVRDMHKALDKTKQKFSRPPVTNPQGKRNNPGEDYNCRCVAIPIVKIA